MKRSIEALVVVEMVVAIAVLAIAGMCGVARAEPAQHFGMQLSQPDGRVTVRMQLRLYDTTGVVPPALSDYAMRLPLGVELREQFLDERWFCDGEALRNALDARPSRISFNRRVAKLAPFIRSLARSRAKRDRRALATARVCERARFGIGTGLIDARRVTDALPDPIPIKFATFLSRPTVPGAVAGFTVVGAADERSAVVKRDPVVAGVHAVYTANIVEDPTPDGLYGFRVQLPTGPIGGFDVSIAEIDMTLRSLKIAKGACVKQGRRGRCAKRQRTDAFLFGLPRCPPSGQLSAQLLAAFAAPMPSLTTTVPIPCPRFSR